jgi:ribonucleoside-triphosphate reductase
MEVIKRDGTRVPFNLQKIIIAINKAMMSVDGALYETDTSTEIANSIQKLNKNLSVE